MSVVKVKNFLKLFDLDEEIITLEKSSATEIGRASCRERVLRLV